MVVSWWIVFFAQCTGPHSVVFWLHLLVCYESEWVHCGFLVDPWIIWVLHGSFKKIVCGFFWGLVWVSEHKRVPIWNISGTKKHSQN